MIYLTRLCLIDDRPYPIFIFRRSPGSNASLKKTMLHGIGISEILVENRGIEAIAIASESISNSKFLMKNTLEFKYRCALSFL